MLNGNIHPDYADVAASVIRQIPPDRGGTAVAVYHCGDLVVDLWGGTKDRAGSPWTEETTAPSFSTTKGVLATLVHILVDRGLADYDDPVAKYWPAFAANGKSTVTIRQALSHESGLYAIADLIESPAEMRDWEHMKALIAGAELAHEPGTANAYHALTFGWIIGGLIEEMTGKSLEQNLQEELVDPLQLDGMFIGMPHNELYRRAELMDGISRPPEKKEPWRENLSRGVRQVLSKVGVEIAESRKALAPFTKPFDWNDEATVTAKIPAANGQFTARSLARMYAMIAEGGELDGVRVLSKARTVLMGQVQNRRRDNVLFLPMHWRMGYHRIINLGTRTPDAFGHFGYGGSGAFCDPTRRLAVALTTNTGSGSALGDARMLKIGRAAIGAVDRLAKIEGAKARTEVD